ncbi:MAG: SUMF1/EgtB/PvdO family nonheme iron enzyme [Geobacteraceae bacterium]|nr:SUMF1/EgtB/PvdO family nonheme iron enzyme [Geobacteraceae bacterium]
MCHRFFTIVVLVLLVPALCFAAAKTPVKASDARSLKPVAKSDGRRVALVVGDGTYKHPDSMPRLSNPTNDADDIAAALRQFGFDVVAKKNLGKEEMENAIADFGRRSANSDAALFYYAGHGLQVKGRNYLVPVDAKIDTEAQVPYRSVDVNQLLDEMENSRSRVNIVMLDACRNNQISGSFRSGATRGLAAPTSSPKGTVIVYATDPGNVAADGSGRNGLFTAGLLTAFKGDDLSLFGVLTKASEEVELATGQKQTPYINGPATVQKNFSFVPVQSQQVAMAPRPQQPPAKVEPPPQRSTSLDDMMADSLAAERTKTERTEKIKADVAKYRKIIASRLELKQAAWDALVSSYPEARGVPVGSVGRLLEALGMGNLADSTTGMKFVVVPEGCFQMGDSKGNGSSDEKPVHQVCLDAFSIGKYEVTQGQWKKVMGGNPSEFVSCGDNCPVEQVSWNDVQQFISRLNSQSSTNYRLPTEAEWEYACRAGGTEEYCGSNDINAVAWCSDNSGSQTHSVGQKQANGWGIHDMSGNVWEWVQDWYNKSYYVSSPQSNPQGPSSGSYRVVRGGSWARSTDYVRASARNPGSPGGRIDFTGFRLVAPIQ